MPALPRFLLRVLGSWSDATQAQRCGRKGTGVRRLLLSTDAPLVYSGRMDAGVGAQLRSAREAAGLSLAVMSSMVPYSKSALGHFETGARTPTAEVVSWYERALGVEVDPVMAMESLGRADVDRRSFLRGAAYAAALSALPLADAPALGARFDPESGRTAGMSDVEAIRSVTDAFLGIDESRGAIGRTAIAEFLATDVAPMLRGRFATSDVRAAAFSAAAEVAYLAGFKAHDGGLDGLAQRYYLNAYRLAQETGDPGQEAFVLRILALQGVDIGERRYSVRLAEQAVSRVLGRFNAETVALFQVGLARCHAESGEKKQAISMLRRTHGVIETQGVSEFPRWAAMWCPNNTTTINQTAKAFAAVREVGAAADHFQLAASMWNRNTHARVYSLTATDAGLARWDLGDYSEAASIWHTAIPALKSVDSSRTNGALSKIHERAPELLGA
jgi:transcriptional regulator with XRE-family HTH domain